MITLVVFTHGRDYLQRTIQSFQENVTGPITDIVLNNDAPIPYFNPDYFDSRKFKYLRELHYLRSGGIGFAGAIDNAWNYINSTVSHNPYIFHLEDDFVFNRKIDLWEMMVLLDSFSDVAQMALMRQACNPEEIKAKGLYNLHGDAFHKNNGWVDHSLWFTTNPCMYRRELIREFDWPQEDQSEGKFTIQLREAGYRFGYMGKTDDKPWVTHIGLERANGKGY